MTYTLDTIRLLIAHDSQDEAEQIMNALRNAGKITRAELVLNEDDFLRQIKSGGCELILARPSFGGCDYPTVIGHLKRLGKSVPVIVMVDGFDAEYLKKVLAAGGSAAVPAGDRELLYLLVDQQLERLRLHKELLESDLALQEAERRLSILMDQSRDAIAYVLDGMHIHANEAYLEMFGYESADDLAGVPIMDMVSAGDHEKLKKLLRNRAQDESQTQELVCRGVTTEDKEFDATFVFSASTYDDEECTQIVIRAAAGMDDEQLQQKLHEISITDQITGLYTRSWFVEQVDKGISAAVKNGELHAVFYLRIDDFEKHQSTVGIEGGDELLSKIAEYMKSCADNAPLARVVGEDFSLLQQISDPEEAKPLAEKIRAGVEKLMPEINGRTLQVTASIGVAFTMEDSRGGQAVITKALECCNKAQKDNDGKGNSIYVHDPMDEVSSGSPEAILMSVRQALENNSFKLLYQPIMNLEDDTDHFFEVFISLPQKEGDDIKPHEFMPIADEHGLAGKIDRWVILQSMKAAVAQQENVRLLVNLSGHSLQDTTLVDWIGKAMKAAKFDAGNLTFQFSEADTTSFLKLVAAFSKRVAEMGCSTSVSRFGGGINAFNIFEHLTASMVKLDGSYTQELSTKEGKEKLVELAGQANEKQMKVLVGFVESAAQMQTLWTLGKIDYLQGYYLQAPESEIQIAAAVEE